MGLGPNFKEIQQDMTELNGDGNRERGRDGETIVSFLEEEEDGGDDFDQGQSDQDF